MDATNALGWGLYRHLAARGRSNLVVSPASAALALAILEAGSDGATRGELLAVLNGGAPEESFQVAASALLGGEGPGFAEVTNASRLAVRPGVTLEPAFERAVRRRFGVEVETADAPAVGAELGAASHTVISARTRFAARWAHPFLDRLAQPAPFVRGDGVRVLVPTLWLRAEVRFGEVQGAIVVELPYEGGRFSMLLVRPTGTEPLAQLDASPASLGVWLASLEPVDLELSMPRFAIGPQSHHLDEGLRDLGIERAFDPERADLSRLADSDQGLSVASVLQRVRVDVDEYGTSAEATTIGTIADTEGVEAPRRVRFDRPFVFVLRHHATGLVYFIGRVTDPRVEPRTEAP